MVVFPFKQEDPEVAVANIIVAASHPRVDLVTAVAAANDDTFAAVSRATEGVDGAAVEVLVQERIGRRRPGKGDGMNTGLRRFLATGLDRLHFYDADITNFDSTWIDAAEVAADRGYATVRHYFPRASTDAMITWMVTRPLFAIGHPGSRLWKIRQPLGGELLVTRPIALALAKDPFVQGTSDWGIDTAITYATVALGEPVFESYVTDGKQHALYGSLEELREMVVECYEAAAAVTRLPAPRFGGLEAAPAAIAPPAIAFRVGYDVEKTLPLLTDGWAPAEVSAAAELPEGIGGPLLQNLVRPTFAFLDTRAWYQALVALQERYRPEPGWRGVLFRLWVARVLAYTTSDALSGHAHAMEILEGAVASYARWSGDGEQSDGGHPE